MTRAKITIISPPRAFGLARAREALRIQQDARSLLLYYTYYVRSLGISSMGQIINAMDEPPLFFICSSNPIQLADEISVCTEFSRSPFLLLSAQSTTFVGFVHKVLLSDDDRRPQWSGKVRCCRRRLLQSGHTNDNKIFLGNSIEREKNVPTNARLADCGCIFHGTIIECD